ncbi:MAG: IclR family transcriptional regulator [Sphaerochaetaceae bacterium]
MLEKECKKTPRVNATAKALSILGCFSPTLLEITLAQFSKMLDMPKSTLLNQLRTLEDAGMVMRTGNNAFRLGYKIMNLSYCAHNAISISQYAIPVMEDLEVETGQNLYLTTHVEGQVFYLECVYPSRRLVSYSISGKLLPMHCTGCGKAMLSFMDKKQVETIIDQHGLPQITPNTITKRDELFKALSNYRAMGYAIDNEEESMGVRCVAAAIRTSKGTVAGALSISGSVLSMRDEVLEQYAVLLSKACNTLVPYAHLFPYYQNYNQL